MAERLDRPIAAKTASMVYLGVDPGLNRTGYAVLERSDSAPIFREGGVIRSKSTLSLAERVHEIGSGLREVIAEYGPRTMGIEQALSRRGNPKSSLLMAQARGAILFVAAEKQLAVVHYAPTQVKRLLTGSGRAAKDQMQRAVMRELGLSRLPEPHDVADAAAVALCVYHSVKFAEINGADRDTLFKAQARS